MLRGFSAPLLTLLSLGVLAQWSGAANPHGVKSFLQEPDADLLALAEQTFNALRAPDLFTDQQLDELRVDLDARALRARNSNAPESSIDDWLGKLLECASAKLQSQQAPGFLLEPDSTRPEAVAWLAAALSPVGDAQTQAVAAALRSRRGSSTPLSSQPVNLAWETWMGAVDERRFDAALAVGERLHGETGAEWSAISLAVTAVRAGEYKLAQDALRRQIENQPSAALWNQLGLAYLGAGQTALARSALGNAILLASRDAGSTLARLELSQGQSRLARAAFRADLVSGKPGPWTRRGWGLAQIGPRISQPDSLSLHKQEGSSPKAPTSRSW